MPGIHYVPAIAGSHQGALSKKVNFDDPSTCHFYYGDETGSRGTILNFLLGQMPPEDGAV
jgi:glyoxalase family protein